MSKAHGKRTSNGSSEGDTKSNPNISFYLFIFILFIQFDKIKTAEGVFLYR